MASFDNDSTRILNQILSFHFNFYFSDANAKWTLFLRVIKHLQQSLLSFEFDQIKRKAYGTNSILECLMCFVIVRQMIHNWCLHMAIVWCMKLASLVLWSNRIGSYESTSLIVLLWEHTHIQLLCSLKKKVACPNSLLHNNSQMCQTCWGYLVEIYPFNLISISVPKRSHS